MGFALEPTGSRDAGEFAVLRSVVCAVGSDVAAAFRSARPGGLPGFHGRARLRSAASTTGRDGGGSSAVGRDVGQGGGRARGAGRAGPSRCGRAGSWRGARWRAASARCSLAIGLQRRLDSSRTGQYPCVPVALRVCVSYVMRARHGHHVGCCREEAIRTPTIDGLDMRAPMRSAA
jgi:hypothetical protein